MVFGHFKVPTYIGKRKRSWEYLNPEELKEYMARKKKVKSKVNQLTQLDRRNPSMKQRIIVYKDLYRNQVTNKSMKLDKTSKGPIPTEIALPTGKGERLLRNHNQITLSQPTIMGSMDSGENLNPVDEQSDGSGRDDDDQVIIASKRCKESTMLSNNGLTMASLGEYNQFSGIKEPLIK